MTSGLKTEWAIYSQRKR